jgi:hypothetical protein
MPAKKRRDKRDLLTIINDFDNFTQALYRPVRIWWEYPFYQIPIYAIPTFVCRRFKRKIKRILRRFHSRHKS